MVSAVYVSKDRISFTLRKSVVFAVKSWDHVLRLAPFHGLPHGRSKVMSTRVCLCFSVWSIEETSPHL